MALVILWNFLEQREQHRSKIQTRHLDGKTEMEGGSVRLTRRENEQKNM